RIEKGAPVVIEKKTWTGTMRVWWLLKGNSDSNPRSLAVDQGFPSSIGGALSGIGSFISGAIDENRCDGIDDKRYQSSQSKKKVSVLVSLFSYIGGFFAGLYALWIIQNGSYFWRFVFVILCGTSSLIYGLTVFLKVIVE